MDNSALVSVVIPVYNAGNYLSPAIESILNQTYKHFELILIDDGSTDGSKEIAQKFAAKDKRIQLIEHPKNIGKSVAMNNGFAAVKGKYIMVMDADDISLPQRMELQVRYLQTHPDVDLCGCRQQYIPSKVTPYVPEDHDRICCYLMRRTVLPTPTWMLKTEAVHKHHLYFDLEQDLQDDIYFLVFYQKKLRYACLPQILHHYRIHEKQRTRVHHELLINANNQNRIWVLKQMGVEPTDEEIKLHLKWVDFNTAIDSRFGWLG